jgi:hypothetical protein
MFIVKLFKKKKPKVKTEHTMKDKISLIGKKMIVRANVAGVHAGVVESFDGATQTVTLSEAYRLWRIYTRDNSGSISDVAANGLKPKGGHSIGAMLESVTIVNPQGLELAEMTDKAYESIENWKN